MLTKIKYWAAGLLAALLGVYALRQRATASRRARNAAIHAQLAAELEAQEATVVEARAVSNAVAKMAKDKAVHHDRELKAIDARLAKREGGRLGRLLKKFEETER